MKLDHFKNLYKKERSNYILNPSAYANHIFVKYKFDQKNYSFFKNTPDDFVYGMRSAAWNDFLILEKAFNASMATMLLDHSQSVKSLSSVLSNVNLNPEEKVKKVIGDYIKLYDEHIYELNKSNTQSRRSRTGKEFEAIICKLLTYTHIKYDTQGTISKKLFSAVGLGKLVDCVVPGALEYNSEKHKCALISMKTTLRERWAEVAEELTRTGAQSMYLLTLDDDISDDKINNLYTHNIILVVPDHLKSTYHSKNPKVYGFSNLLSELDNIMTYWKNKTPESLGEEYFTHKIENLEIKIQNSNIMSEKEILNKQKEELEKQLYSLTTK